jgi:hypothetical protein
MRSLDEVHRDRAELVHVIRELETLSMRESAVSIRA